MSYFESVRLSKDDITLDAGGRVRVSQLRTLEDGKLIGFDRQFIFDGVGSGSGTHSNNVFSLYAGSGQYYIRQSRQFLPYFSGKSHPVEETFQCFHLQEGVVKRIGYFSSQSTGTYDTNKDGFWLESNGVSGSFYLVASRQGVETHRSDWRDWDNYSGISGTNWQNFNVILFDFLWLGGAWFRLFIKTQTDFLLAHEYTYAGTEQNVFIRTPNQPIRYEIRGITGAGELVYVCSQVSTEGSTDSAGESGWIDSGVSPITLSSVGTKYAVKGIRKKSDYKDVAVKITNADVFISSVDSVRWTLEINPYLSSGIAWNDVPFTGLQEFTGTGLITVSGTSRILAGGYITQTESIDQGVFKDNFLVWLGGKIDGTQDQFILCVTPITNNVSAYGGIGYTQY